MAAKNGVSLTLDRLADVTEGVRLLGRLHVMVGIPEDKNDRRDFDAEMGNAALLYVHENGAPEAGIPARPTLNPGIKNAQQEINRRLELAGHAALDGRPSSVRAQFAAAGQAGASSVKRMINSNVQPPLKPATIAARKRAGVKSERTLVRTGQMRNAVTYVVEEN